MSLPTILVLSFATLALAQRPFFAGLRPIGYPEVTTEALADRFGEIDGTTQRLPVEANGDRDLVDRLSKLPIDKQPFWLINWQALEAHRQNPQTYPQKPNPFVDPPQNNGGSNAANSNSGISGSVNPNSGHSNVKPGKVNTNSGNINSTTGNVNSSNEIAPSGANAGVATSNRFGVEENTNNEDIIVNDFSSNSPPSDKKKELLAFIFNSLENQAHNKHRY